MLCQLLTTHYKNCRQPAEVYMAWLVAILYIYIGTILHFSEKGEGKGKQASNAEIFSFHSFADLKN